MRVPAAPLFALFALLATACSKTLVAEEDAQVTDLPPLEPGPPPSAMPSESSAQPGLQHAGSGAEAGGLEAGADAGARGRARGSEADGGDAGGGCGDPPLGDCPLKAWMKANCAAAVTHQDLEALAYAFDKIATYAPPDGAGFVNWVSIAKDGADAARAASMVGVKGACRGCHQQYKDRYKATLRARALP
jgi:hypothetical protein